MGPATIARVNPSNLYITALYMVASGRFAISQEGQTRATHAGTAGAMFDFLDVAVSGLRILGSFSLDTSFSPAIVLREVIFGV